MGGSVSRRTRALAAVATAVALACPVAVVSATSAAAPAPPAAAPPEVPAGFQDTIAIGGLSEPVAWRSPRTGPRSSRSRPASSSPSTTTPATGQFEPFADHVNFTNLDVQVNNYWDRGLTGIAVDPQFGTAGNNYIYVNYAYNRDPRDTPAIVPKWGRRDSSTTTAPNPARWGRRPSTAA